MLGGCDRLSQLPWFRSILDSAERLTLRAQRLLLLGAALAQRVHRGRPLAGLPRQRQHDPRRSETYQTLAANGFADWRLEVDGLVEKPLSSRSPNLRAMPSRTQITRHDCVEGWSCIGKWKGVPLGACAGRSAG